MIAILCQPCGKGIVVTPGDDGEVENLFFEEGELSRTLACPFCGGDRLHKLDAAQTSTLEVQELTPKEAFAAFSGLGFPDEQDCSPTAVATALTSSPVKTVTARPIKGSHRALIEIIELENGTKLFFGASVHGASVYRISRPRSYAEEVLRGS